MSDTQLHFVALAAINAAPTGCCSQRRDITFCLTVLLEKAFFGNFFQLCRNGFEEVHCANSGNSVKK